MSWELKQALHQVFLEPAVPTHLLGYYVLLGEPQDHATSMLAQLQCLSAQGPEQFPVHQPAGRGGQHLPRLAERLRRLVAVCHRVSPAMRHLLGPLSPSLPAAYWLCSLLSTGVTCGMTQFTLGQPCLSTELFMQHSLWELHPFTVLFSFNTMTYFCRLYHHGSEILMTNGGNCGCLLQVQAEDGSTRSIAEEPLRLTATACEREASPSC